MADVGKLTDEPSELAMRISAQLQGSDEFTVLATEIGQLSEFERRVLDLTARKQGWEATIANGWGKTIFRRAISNTEPPAHDAGADE